MVEATKKDNLQGKTAPSPFQGMDTVADEHGNIGVYKDAFVAKATNKDAASKVFDVADNMPKDGIFTEAEFEKIKNLSPEERTKILAKPVDSLTNVLPVKPENTAPIEQTQQEATPHEPVVNTPPKPILESLFEHKTAGFAIVAGLAGLMFGGGTIGIVALICGGLLGDYADKGGFKNFSSGGENVNSGTRHIVTQGEAQAEQITLLVNQKGEFIDKPEPNAVSLIVVRDGDCAVKVQSYAVADANGKFPIEDGAVKYTEFDKDLKFNLMQQGGVIFVDSRSPAIQEATQIASATSNTAAVANTQTVADTQIPVVSKISTLEQAKIDYLAAHTPETQRRLQTGEIPIMILAEYEASHRDDPYQKEADNFLKSLASSVKRPDGVFQTYPLPEQSEIKGQITYGNMKPAKSAGI